MSGLRRFLQRLVHAFRPNRAEADLQREVASHLALLEDEYRRRGMSQEQAYTEARKAIGGGAEQAKIRHRDARSFVALDELRTDVKYAVRRLRGRPGASVLAVAMLAIAVGLSTAMFTIVDALIVRPLPFPHADRLTGLYMAAETGSGNLVVSSRLLEAWRGNPGFERVEGARTFAGVIESSAGPMAREGAIVTSGLLDMLGVRPLHGRLFDAQHLTEDEVLLSATLWRTAFQSDEAILGQEIRIDGERRIVVGILPPSFRFPRWNTDVWRVGPMSAGQEYRPYVRIAAGVPEDDALRVATEAASATGEFPTTWRAAREPIVGGYNDTYYQRAVSFLAGAVVLVTVVLCFNVSSLLLTRLRARRRELVVCAALGASRARLLRQTVVESVMLGACGVGAGLLLAWTLVTVAGALLPQAFLTNSLNPVALDIRALVAAATVGLVSICAACVIPAWLGTRAHRAAGHLVERGGTETRQGRWTVRTLLTSEVALACALLIGATLLVRSFVNVTRIDRGFDPTGMVTAWISIDGADASPEAGRVLTAAVEERVRALPGVQATAWSRGVPLGAGSTTRGRWESGLPGAEPVEVAIEHFVVGPNYFDFYGIPLLKGRGFVDGDGNDVAIVGERFAAAVWPGVDPIGRSFPLRFPDRTVRIVGVAKETRRSIIDENLDRADVYLAFDGRGRDLYLSLRCDSVCPSEGVLRQQLSSFGQVFRVTHLDAAFARDLEQPRASAALAGTFALVALIASAGGLFGVLSYAVQERRREFGIRAAIGATPAAIAKVVFREGAIVGATGLLIGTALAAALASTLASLSYQVTAFDPLSVAAIVVTLVLTMVLALWRPARTAAKTDPALLLKEE